MLPEAACIPSARRVGRWAGVLLACAALSGCYLAQATRGHLRLMAARQPIDAILSRPETQPALRARLEYVQRVRRFASTALALPDNGSFTSLVRLDRPFVAWSVFAAPEFSVEPRQWCFPVTGCVAYRGYFSERAAQDYARQLTARGYDVQVSPIAAYSTLGHFDDPVLSTMLDYGDVELAGLIFHELAHQVVYVPGDSPFNEAFAMAVEIEGVRRWLQQTGRSGELAAYLETRRQLFAVTDLLAETRARLASLYASGLGAAAMRAAKQDEFARLRADYAELRAGWQDAAYADRLMAGDFNNARLAATSTYHRCLPGFTRMLAGLGGSLQDFYTAVQRLGREDAARRDAAVCALPSAAGAATEAGEAAAPALAP